MQIDPLILCAILEADPSFASEELVVHTSVGLDEDKQLEAPGRLAAAVQHGLLSLGEACAH